MMVMCGQHNSIWHYLAGKHPGKVGVLYGPSYFNAKSIKPWMPYALDNDAFQAWNNKTAWDEKAWVDMLHKAKTARMKPIWCLVPDVVADKDATIAAWQKYHGVVVSNGFKTAFAVQDGMEPKDVPADADVVFVGGTTSWKLRTLSTWAKHFKRVHVGRVNTLRRLMACESFGVESVDGSGWFRDTADGRRMMILQDWMNGSIKHAQQLFDCAA